MFSQFVLKWEVTEVCRLIKYCPNIEITKENMSGGGVIDTIQFSPQLFRAISSASFFPFDHSFAGLMVLLSWERNYHCQLKQTKKCKTCIDCIMRVFCQCRMLQWTQCCKNVDVKGLLSRVIKTFLKSTEKNSSWYNLPELELLNKPITFDWVLILLNVF